MHTPCGDRLSSCSLAALNLANWRHPHYASSLYAHLCFVHLTLGYPIELLKNKRQNLLYIYLGTLGMIKSLASEVGIHVTTCEENHEQLDYVQFKK